MPTPAPNTYPFDGSGTAVTNMVEDELHTLTLVNYRDYHFLVPNFAPFFAQGLNVKFQQNPGDPFIDLTEGIDYYPALPFIGATRATGKAVYGAISFNNLTLEGQIKLRYQTVGGEWTLGLTDLTEIAANIIYNPRTTTWEKITNVPCHFPPLDHAWELSDMVGEAEILEELVAIEEAILNKNMDQSWLNHITNFSNPHRVTKSQVGLNKVQNYAPATIAECIAAASSQLYVTPIGLRAFFESLGLDRSLDFVSLQEVIEKISVPKILTFDLFLEYMRLYGGSGGGGGTQVGNLPLVLYPTEQGLYVKDQAFKCNTFSDTTPGTVNKIINLNGTGTHIIPQGTGVVRITGRGAIGGIYMPPFTTKSTTFSGTGSGTFTVPAGGSILSIRGKGAAGTAGVSGGPTVFNNIYNTSQSIVIPIGVTSVTLTGKGGDGNPAVAPYSRPDSGGNNLDYYFVYGSAGFVVGGNTTIGSDKMAANSQDLRTWNLSQSGIINIPNKGVVFNSQIGYVGISDTVVRVSTDGLSWTATTQNSANYKSLVSFGNHVYVVDELKKVRRSTNAVDWTVVYDNPGADNIELSVMDNNIFIHTFSLNGGPLLSENINYKSSTDGITWTAATHATNATKYARSKVKSATVTIMGSVGVLNENTLFVNGNTVDAVSLGIKASTIIKANDKFYARALVGQSFLSSTDGLTWVDGSRTATPGNTASVIINGQTYNFEGEVGGPATPRVETVTLNGLADTNLTMDLPDGTSTLKVTYNYIAPVTNVINPGADATITVNGGLRTFQGSITTSDPNSRNDEVPINPNTTTIVTYNSPVGTELELIYQDYDATGNWIIKKYYSSKITNPTTGSANLLEDTDGTVIALPTTSTGEWMSNRTSIALEPTTPVPTAYILQLVASASNSTRRVFEYRYNVGGTEVTIKVVSELLIDNNILTSGESAKVTILAKDLTYPGSADNNTIPQIRTDEVILVPNAETVVTYNCPVGTSVVLNYNEPNVSQPITHADTEWEIATSNTFITSSIVGGTAQGKGAGFSLTQWKPTNPNDYINNTDYFIRVRWIKSDATTSPWSEIRSFKFSTGVTVPPRDQLISKFCKLFDQWGTFADGNGGSYEKQISANEPACGYVPPPTGTGPITDKLTAVNIIISNSIIKEGMTSVITCTATGTVTGKIYNVDYLSKLSSAPDSSYTVLNSAITFTGGVGSTTIFTIPLGWEAKTLGTFNGKIKVTEQNVSSNTVTSNVITATFEPSTGGTNPTPTSSGAQTEVLTISSTHTDISIGTPEKITVTLNNGKPNTYYNLMVETMRTVNNGIKESMLVLFDMWTNSSGIGIHKYDAGNTGLAEGPSQMTKTVDANGNIITQVFEGYGNKVIPTPSSWQTTAYLMNVNPRIASNTINRNFLAPVATGTVSTNVIGSNSVSVGESRNIRASLTGFKPNANLTARWYWTPPGGSRQPWNGSINAQVVSQISIASNGSGYAEITVSNNGSMTPGTANFEVIILENNQTIATPGGNSPASINFIRNIEITITSNMPYPTPITTASNENITITVTNGPPNKTLNMAARARFLSGNSAGVNTSTYYDTPFILVTNSSGYGTATIQAGNKSYIIPYPSEWSRQAVIISTGDVSELIKVIFAPISGQDVPQSTVENLYNVQFSANKTQLSYSESGAFTLVLKNTNAGAGYSMLYQARRPGDTVWTNMDPGMFITSATGSAGSTSVNFSVTHNQTDLSIDSTFEFRVQAWPNNNPNNKITSNSINLTYKAVAVGNNTTGQRTIQMTLSDKYGGVPFATGTVIITKDTDGKIILTGHNQNSGNYSDNYKLKAPSLGWEGIVGWENYTLKSKQAVTNEVFLATDLTFAVGVFLGNG